MYEDATGTPKEKINEMRRKLYAEKNGLDVNNEWGTDETLVDWIALQFPKMEKAFKEADCL